MPPALRPTPCFLASLRVPQPLYTPRTLVVFGVNGGVRVHCTPQARRLLRHAIVREGQRLLARMRVEDRRHSHIVTHLSLLRAQVRLSNLRDEKGSGHEETLEAATGLAKQLKALHALPNAQQYREQAVGLLEQIVFERRRTVGETHPATITAVNNLALGLHANGDAEAASVLFAEVHKARRATLGESHPSTLAVAAKLGQLQASKGQHADAEATLRATLEGRRRTHGEESEATIRSLLSLANAINAQPEREAEAEALYREALDTCRAVFGLAHELTLIALNNLGCLLQASGTKEELAEVCLREGLKGSQQLYGEGHIEALIAASNLGNCLHRKGKVDEAADFLYDAYDGVAHVKKS